MIQGAWALVLTLVTGPRTVYVPAPAAIEVVEGFTTEADCLAAGKKWGDAALKILPPGGKATAVCVRLYRDTRVFAPGD